MDRLRVIPFQPGATQSHGIFLIWKYLTITAFLTLSIHVSPAWCQQPDTSGAWFVDMNTFLRSAHGSLTCERCHPEMKEPGKVHPDRKDPSAIRKNVVHSYDYKRCATCHPVAYKHYILGEHAKAMEKEKQNLAAGIKEQNPDRLAPKCGDCHSSHYAQSKRSRIQLGTQMTETCGKCHKAQEASYLKNIHGRMGVFLGKKSSAYCTDCHGTHTCESLKDKQKALEACRRCHRDATIQFASIVIHSSDADISKKDPEKQANIALVGAVKRIGTIGGIIILAFFALQTFVWILRELHRKLRGR